VVHRHGVPGLEDENVEAELRELRLALELADCAASFRLSPARVA
jgi:hypothetical protein